MPPLNNARHERFVQLLLQGESATDAHEAAGYTRDDGNATRLANNPKVVERLRELQAEIAGENKVTVASLLDELEAARKKAPDLDQLSAAVRAIEAKAKVSGLLVQKVEVGGPGDFAGCDTVEDIIDAMVNQIVTADQQASFSAKDKAKIVQMFTDLFEFVDSCKARPVVSAYGYNPDTCRIDSERRFARGEELRRQLANGKGRPVNGK